MVSTCSLKEQEEYGLERCYHAECLKLLPCTYLVLASIILMVTGFSPGIPGVTSEAKTDVL